MSMILPHSYTCAVCGEMSQHMSVASTNTFGGTPDLDLRPPEMKRSTMPFWAQECPHCGYVARRIENPAGKIDKGWLLQPEYTMCSGIEFVSDLAPKFYKQYLICRETDDIENAFYAVLYAAWACDDESDSENAKHCRTLAIAEIEKLLKEDAQNESLQLIKADLLRRAGQFETLAHEYEGKTLSDERFQKILQFQLEKAKQGDTNCYRVADVNIG